MAKFHDLISQIKSHEGEDPLPATIYDDLLCEYDTAFEGYQENSNKALQETEKLRSEVSRLKSDNYDLLTQVSNGSDPIDGIEPQEENPVTIDDLFKRK